MGGVLQGGIRMNGTAGLRVRLCGGLVVEDGDLALGPRDVGGAKARQVLMALLFEAGASVSKGRLIEFLWVEAPPVHSARWRPTSVCSGSGSRRCSPAGRRSSRSRAATAGTWTGRPSTSSSSPGSSPPHARSTCPGRMRWTRMPLPSPSSNVLWRRWTATCPGSRSTSPVTTPGCSACSPTPRASRWTRATRPAPRPGPGTRSSATCSSRRPGRCCSSRWSARDARPRRCGSTRPVARSSPKELGCDPGPGLRTVFTRLLAATSSDDDGLRDLVDAVVRLHVRLLAHGGAGRGAGRLPSAHAAGGRGAGGMAQPEALASLEEDCRRLRSLLRAASGTVPSGLPGGRPAGDVEESGHGVTTRPSRSSRRTGPRTRESTERERSSPMTKTAPAGTATGPNHTLSIDSSSTHGSVTGTPSTTSRPSSRPTTSPPTATTRA